MSTSPVLAPVRLVLDAETAAELMTPNPISIRGEATVQDALVLLTDKNIRAAPVINQAGQPIGVVSRSDILLHERESHAAGSAVPHFYQTADLSVPAPVAATAEAQRAVPVREIMTPVVFSVRP